MAFRRALLLVLGSAPFLLPLAAHATGIPFFGPIVPSGPEGMNPQVCAAGWAALAQLINNILAFSITIGILFIAPLSIAWAGFLYVVNSVNPSGIAQAKKILLNTIIGVVIALSAWLIVNALLTALTVLPGGGAGGVQGFTAQMFNGGDSCLKIATQLNEATGQDLGVGTPDVVVTTGPVGTGPTSGGAFCPDGATQTGPAGCAKDGQFVLPNGESCSSGSSFNTDYGGCVDAGGAVTAPVGSPTVGGNPTLPSGPLAERAGAAVDALAHGTNQYGGQCWGYVRQALCNAGYDACTPGYSVSVLERAGFQTVVQNSLTGYTPQVGDVAHFDPVGQHTSGHVSMWNGTQWVSDTRQTNATDRTGFIAWPDQRNNPNLRYQVYRHP